MREIDLSGTAPPPRVTILSYGALRSGKTRWSATFPRPLFLAEGTEGGWQTINNMRPESFYEIGRVPRVWTIDKVADMMQAVGDAEPLIERGDVQTLVIDSLSFYNDLYLSFLIRLARKQDQNLDMRRVYGDLGSHLRELRIRVHNLPVNVIWLALDRPPDEKRIDGGPMVTGQQSVKFAAGCDYILYHRSFQANADAPLQFEIRTRRWRQFPAGGRDEGRLPDPLGYWAFNEANEQVFVSDCSYLSFADALGIPRIVQEPVGEPVGVARVPA